MISERCGALPQHYEGYDDYPADAYSSADEDITSEMHNALHQLVLNQAVAALKKGVRGMLSALIGKLRRKNKRYKKMCRGCFATFVLNSYIIHYKS